MCVLLDDGDVRRINIRVVILEAQMEEGRLPGDTEEALAW